MKASTLALVFGLVACAGTGEPEVAVDSSLAVVAPAVPQAAAVPDLISIDVDGGAVDKGTSQHIDIPVAIAHPATYYVWLRGAGGTGDSSVRVALDATDRGPDQAAIVIADFDGRSAWASRTPDGDPAAVTIPSAGTHQIDLWIDGAGLVLDTLVMTEDPVYRPDGGGPAAAASSAGHDQVDYGDYHHHHHHHDLDHHDDPWDGDHHCGDDDDDDHHHGQACGNGVVETGEQCDGGACCDSTCHLASPATVCRASAGACDVSETCTGTSAACPADGFASAATECRPSAGPCDVSETCTGSAAGCPADGFASAATECRPSAGPCDVSETCTGSAAGCPADGFASDATECRPSAGPCDVSETCTGSAAGCPADVIQPAGTVCRAAVDSCDATEACNGATVACPDDAHLNEPPQVSAGPGQELELPADTVTLAGAVTDDSCPTSNPVTTTWSVVSGPAAVVFGDPGAAQTTATFTVDGTYVLELAASDGQDTATDQTVVTVYPVNQPPVVNAGTDRLVSQPEMSAVLFGTATDDGLPLGSALSAAWTVVSGPDTVTFDPPDAAQTTATFGALGTYVLRLSAGDSAYLVSDDVEVTVAIAPDLTVADVDGSGMVVDGETLAVSGTVSAEIDDLAGPAHGYTVMFFEDRDGDGVFDPMVDNALGSATRPGQGAGELATVVASVTGQLQFAGSTIYAWADSEEVLAEPDESNNVGSTEAPCEVSGPAHTFAPRLKWSWQGAGAVPTSRQVMMTPAVADLNGDGVPDLVFSTFTGALFTTTGNLRAIDGRTGGELFTVTDPAHAVSGVSQVAVGDLDHDGSPEIVAVGSGGTSVLAFGHDGAFRWQRAVTPSLQWGGASLADLDGDGTPEILIGSRVLNADGTVRWTGTAGTGAYNHGPLSIAVDLDLDGVPEVVAGRTAYRADGSVYWTNANVADGLTAIGNFDADGNPEIVLAGAGTIWVLEHTGAVKWVRSTSALGGNGGPVTVADFDGDGQPEIGRAGSTKYGVWETDGTLKWTTPTKDSASHVSAASAFDFDGDGAAEVVYTDENGLHVFRGSDGAVQYTALLGGCVGYGNPTVADLDADGRADIVAVANTGASNSSCGASTSAGVFVYSDDGSLGARSIWNQHTYHITNVNDDATIPAHEASSWLTSNSYRENAPSTCPFEVGNLTASYVRITGTGPDRTLTARLGNGGARTIPRGVPVSFYDGDPRAGGVLLGTVTSTEYLEHGWYEDVTLTLTNAQPSTGTIWASADDSGGLIGTIYESDETDNLVDSGLPL